MWIGRIWHCRARVAREHIRFKKQQKDILQGKRKTSNGRQWPVVFTQGLSWMAQSQPQRAPQTSAPGPLFLLPLMQNTWEWLFWETFGGCWRLQDPAFSTVKKFSALKYMSSYLSIHPSAFAGVWVVLNTYCEVKRPLKCLHCLSTVQTVQRKLHIYEQIISEGSQCWWGRFIFVIELGPGSDWHVH